MKVKVNGKIIKTSSRTMANGKIANVTVMASKLKINEFIKDVGKIIQKMDKENTKR